MLEQSNMLANVKLEPQISGEDIEKVSNILEKYSPDSLSEDAHWFLLELAAKMVVVLGDNLKPLKPLEKKAVDVRCLAIVFAACYLAGYERAYSAN